jgi:hypothetical protein
MLQTALVEPVLDFAHWSTLVCFGFRYSDFVFNAPGTRQSGAIRGATWGWCAVHTLRG